MTANPMATGTVDEPVGGSVPPLAFEVVGAWEGGLEGVGVTEAGGGTVDDDATGTVVDD